MYLSGKFYGIKRTFTIQKMDLDTKKSTPSSLETTPKTCRSHSPKTKAEMISYLLERCTKNISKLSKPIQNKLKRHRYKPT